MSFYKKWQKFLQDYFYEKIVSLMLQAIGGLVDSWKSVPEQDK